MESTDPRLNSKCSQLESIKSSGSRRADLVRIKWAGPRGEGREAGRTVIAAGLRDRGNGAEPRLCWAPKPREGEKWRPSWAGNRRVRGVGLRKANQES
jgi:hypothetical protein